MHIFIFFIALLLFPATGFAQTVYFNADAESGVVKPPWSGTATKSNCETPVSSIEQARSGTRSYKHECNPPYGTSAPKSNVRIFPANVIGSHYAFHPGAYHSFWFFIEEGFNDSLWRINVQWKVNNASKTTTGGGGIKTTIGFIVKDDGILQTRLEIPHCDGTTSCHFTQASPIAVPRKQWFLIEIFLKARTKPDGHVIVWQDGVEIFNEAGWDTLTRQEVDNPTVRTDNTDLYLEAGTYSHKESVGTQILYMDDVLFTDYQVSTNVTRGAPPGAPSKLGVTAAK